MRILFISTMAGAAWGGSEELWVKTADLALAGGHEVFVSVYDWPELHPKLAALKQKGARILPRKRIVYGGGTSQRIKGFVVKKFIEPGAITKLKALKPDAIVISQGTIYECMKAEFVNLQSSTGAKTIVITQANSEYETIPPVFYSAGRSLFKNAHHLFFVSGRNRDVAERQLAMKFSNASVVSNPANLSSYGACSWNDSDVLHLAFVGRLDSTVKGLGVLLEILGKKQWKSRSWKLNLYGKGQDESYLKDLAKLYEIENKVNFRGFAEDIRGIWNENHVLVMPSTLEGTPLSLIEAVLCERTAVVSDVGGNAELIDNGRTGFVSEAPSVDSFGKALEQMWQRKQELRELGKNAAKEAKEKIAADGHEKILNSLKQK